jgi:hypothetical protein
MGIHFEDEARGLRTTADHSRQPLKTTLKKKRRSPSQQLTTAACSGFIYSFGQWAIISI